MRKGLTNSILATLTAFALVSATGCSSETQQGPANPDPVGGSPPADPSNPDKPTPPKPPAPTPPDPTATYSGLYEATSALDLTTGGVLPGVMGPIVSSLGFLRDCPGAAVVGMVDAFSPGTIGGVYNSPPPGVCPSSTNLMRNLITTFLDTMIKNLAYNGSPVVTQIATIIDGLAEMFKYIDVIENLRVGTPDASMGVDVEQQVTKISVMVYSVKQTVPLSSTAMAAAYAKTRGSIAPLNAPVADANFSFAAAQNMAIPVGELAYAAVGPILFAPFGATDLSGALKNLINCAQLTANLSSDPTIQGILGPVLQGACDAGIAAIALVVESEIKKVTLKADQGDNVAGKMFDVSIYRPQIDYFTDLVDMDVKWNIGNGTISSKLIGYRKSN